MNNKRLVLLLVIGLVVGSVVGLGGWWIWLRDEAPVLEDLPNTSISQEVPADDVPEGYKRYSNKELDLEFFYPESWELNDRDFGTSAELEAADLPLLAGGFSLSYFADNKARIVLDLPAEKFCQQTKDLEEWQAFEGRQKPMKITDKRCMHPKIRTVGAYHTYSIGSQAEGLILKGIFLPFKGGGGMVFSNSIPISEEDQTIIDNHISSLEAGLYQRITNFIKENPELMVAN